MVPIKRESPTIPHSPTLRGDDQREMTVTRSVTTRNMTELVLVLCRMTLV